MIIQGSCMEMSQEAKMQFAWNILVCYYEDTGRIIFVCAVIPPLGLLLLIAYCFILFHDLCERHKDKIRNFLGIKTNFRI